MNISDNAREAAKRAEEALRDTFAKIDETSDFLTEKVLDVFAKYRVSEGLFAATTGYGYGDRGRDTIDKIAAEIYGAEDGFMRPSIMSGTHAISIGLFGLLRPGDVLLCASGLPYDTLHDVIGLTGNKGMGSLMDFGVEYAETPLKDGKIDVASVLDTIEKYEGRVKVVHLQRSRGYADRPTLSTSEITVLAKAVHESRYGKDVFVFLDNCYGEFCEKLQPCDVSFGSGAVDLMVGSLIKNAGGGMSDIGGYIVGSEKAVLLAAQRLSCPGVGLEVGASLGQNRNLLKGLFYGPHTTAQALKVAHLAAYMFNELGYEVDPAPLTERYDIIQTIKLFSGEALCSFCAGIQAASPVDSFVTPEPWEMPGYSDPVVMAAGAFTGGSSVELSCDGPMRDPYIAFMQGGLTYESGRLAIMTAYDKCHETK